MINKCALDEYPRVELVEQMQREIELLRAELGKRSREASASTARQKVRFAEQQQLDSEGGSDRSTSPTAAAERSAESEQQIGALRDSLAQHKFLLLEAKALFVELNERLPQRPPPPEAGDSKSTSGSQLALRVELEPKYGSRVANWLEVLDEVCPQTSIELRC